MIKNIISPDNETYTAFLRLSRKKYRDVTGEYTAEGVKLVAEALSNGAEIRRVFIREDFGEDGSRIEQKKLIMRLESENIDIIRLPARLFDRASDARTPQGITAVIRKSVYGVSDMEAFFSDSSHAVILDRLQDPGNIGTILRTASSAGFGCVIAMKGTADIFSPKVVRASAGAVFRVKVMHADDPDIVSAALRSRGIKLVCTAPAARELYFETDLGGSLALIIGNEAGGVCGGFMDNSDIDIRLPMENNTESLNASTAAAVIMYEAVRQRYCRQMYSCKKMYK